MEQVDSVVIGAGVVGLAVARALALAGREVLILEAGDSFGGVTSSRNSEVIHAGIYYPTGSLKARLCVRGRELLYAYCAARSVPYRRLGKLLVATDPSQHAKLQALHAQALANGVTDLQPLSALDAMALEPALHCTAALLSPSTGIIDSHALMLSLLADAEAHGAVLALRTPVEGGRITRDGVEIDTGGTSPLRLRARQLVNAAGLWAPRLAAQWQWPAGLPHLLPSSGRVEPPQAHYCKGNYFSCATRPAFSRLVYPMPDAAGLGVHVTLDLGGQMRFGPDTEWLEPPAHEHDSAAPPAGWPDYRVDPARAAGMAEAIRRYWPGLPDRPGGVLQPAYAGVRPKISAPEAPSADFRIDGPLEHGGAPLVQLYGIESPGLTSALALAELVVVRLADRP